MIQWYINVSSNDPPGHIQQWQLVSHANEDLACHSLSLLHHVSFCMSSLSPYLQILGLAGVVQALARSDKSRKRQLERTHWPMLVILQAMSVPLGAQPDHQLKRNKSKRISGLSWARPKPRTHWSSRGFWFSIQKHSNELSKYVHYIHMRAQMAFQSFQRIQSIVIDSVKYICFNIFLIIHI